MVLNAGSIIGSYRVIRPLGEGGMGAVYEVEHEKLGVRYALKTYTLADEHAELFRKRFAGEGRLLARLVATQTGESEAAWERFFENYAPVIRKFAEYAGARGAGEDVAQDVFLKLVGVFREGRYDASRGNFRSYLAAMIRNEVANRWQKEIVRAADRRVSIDDAEHPVDLAVPSETAAILDARWRLAAHHAAEEHVLTKTALSEKTKALYRAYVVEDRPIEEVASAFGVPRNAVSQAKVRIARMIAEHEVLVGVS